MFQFDPTARAVIDETTGERLTGSGHYQDPLNHIRIVDSNGNDIFVCSYRRNFDDFDDNQNGILECIFVSGAVVTKSWLPDRTEAGCRPYFERIGDYLVRSALSKTNVRDATWRVDFKWTAPPEEYNR